MKKRCFNCMKEYEEQYEVCPHCGYVDGSPPAEAYHLAPGEILNHKYIVGTAIDSGGFGIIYRAWDAQMEQVVAIKEYFPNGVVSRVPGQNDVMILSILVDTFISKISLTMQPGPKIDSISGA